MLHRVLTPNTIVEHHLRLREHRVLRGDNDLGDNVWNFVKQTDVRVAGASEDGHGHGNDAGQLTWLLQAVAGHGKPLRGHGTPRCHSSCIVVPSRTCQLEEL